MLLNRALCKITGRGYQSDKNTVKHESFITNITRGLFRRGILIIIQ